LIGVARAYKGINRDEVGLKTYTVVKGNFRVFVDKSVERVRPYIACAVIKGISMDEDLFQEMISFQEDLHEGIGRKRRKVAIGIHNFDVIEFPLYYRVIKDDDFKFIPLNLDRELTIREILNETETGRKYGYILSHAQGYPMILDKRNRVLSFPPIINSNLTRIGLNTRNLFIDVTGIDLKAVLNTINLLSTYLADCGGKIWDVEIIYPRSRIRAPDLKPKEIAVDKDLVEGLLGIKLSNEEIIDCLRACRLDADILNGKIRVKIPPYRIDIMHPVDIVEEVAIGYGYERMTPEYPKVIQIGSTNEKIAFRSMISRLLVGMGMQEVINYTLTSMELQFTKMGLKAEGFVRVKEPKTHGFEVLRRWLIPELLGTLRRSQKEKFPQRIFEIGEVLFRTKDKIIEEWHLAVAITHSKSGYSDVKAVLDVLFDVLELKGRIKPSEHPSFIKGRIGIITIEDHELGLIGEIHPAVLEAFNLENPVSVFEINLDKLFQIYKKGLSKF